MIVTRIRGGLGNQMFQYAIAKAIATKNNDIFKLDISFYPKQTLRKYELHQFKIEENIASQDEILKLAGNQDIWFKIKRKIGRKPKRPISYYAEKEKTVFDENVFKYNDNIYLDGYWQNSEYFENIRGLLLKEFSLKNEISHEAKKYLSDIENSQSISLHVRRGDYVQNSHINSLYGSCDAMYYQKAINLIQKKIVKPTFYIFSDDIVWCKENFNFLHNKIFIDDTKSALDDLELMKNCKHNIIANSTYSWWGAWLNQNNSKIVFAPKFWYRTSEKHLALKTWGKV